MSLFWDQATDIMDKKKLRQADIARALGVSKTTVFNWINRDTLPQVDKALKLADALGASVRFLVTGQDPAELPYRVKELLRLAQGLNESELIYFCDQIKNYRVLEDRKKGEASPDSSESVGS